MIRDYTDKELTQMADSILEEWRKQNEEDDNLLPGDPDYSYNDGWDDGFIAGYIQGYRKAQMEEQ